MANTQGTQENRSDTEQALPQSTALTDEEMGSVAAGNGGPHAMPLCGIKPGRRASTQKYVDGIEKRGEVAHSYNLDTGQITFKPGPGTPDPDLLA